MGILLISAAEFERQACEDGIRKLGFKVTTENCGVGALAAAKKASAIGKASVDQDVIFVGTCGSFSTFEKPFLIRAEKVVWAPTAERAKLAYGITGISPEIPVIDSAKWATKLPPKTVICGPSISLKKFSIPGFKDEDLVENLELYSCAKEILAGCRSLSAILCVTNSLGEDAHSQWQKNHGIAAKMTAEFLEKNLTGMN